MMKRNDGSVKLLQHSMLHVLKSATGDLQQLGALFGGAARMHQYVFLKMIMNIQLFENQSLAVGSADQQSFGSV